MMKQPSRSQQAGAAIIMAMLMMALTTLLISSLFWRQHVTIRSIDNRLALAQTRWIERAAVDWARVILRQDSQIPPLGVDHLTEVWALPVAETRMDETVTAGASIDTAANNASLSGQILDAQGRFNLNNLLTADHKANSLELAAFRKLLRILGQNEGLADSLLAYQLQTRDTEFDGRRVERSQMPLKRVGDLARIEGFTTEVINTLDPHLVVLPGITKVNLNTATPEVIAARSPNMDLSQARGLITLRERNFFPTLAAASSAASGQSFSPEQWSVGSSYFLVRGLVKYDRVTARSDTLLHRRPAGPNSPRSVVEVIWQDRY